MSSKSNQSKSGDSGSSADGKYEYRVWGKHRKARKMLSEMADEETSEEIDDCYFLTDDLNWNAKVRDYTLKVKQLVAEEKGFEVWTSRWVKASKTAPAPFDELLEDLRLDRHADGKSFSLTKAVGRLDPDDVNVVFVTKSRRRFRIGSLRAEVTDVTIKETGDVVRTLAIEGNDLDELVALRKKLGLRDEENLPFPAALGSDRYGPDED